MTQEGPFCGGAPVRHGTGREASEMARREQRGQGAKCLSAAERREKFGTEDAAQTLILRLNGQPQLAPATAALDPFKAEIRERCAREMIAATAPFMTELKDVPVRIKEIFIAVDKPQELTEDLRRMIKLLKREAARASKKLGADKTAKENELKGLMATWRPSRPYRTTDRGGLLKMTLRLGLLEAVLNGVMLYTASFKNGLLASVAAATLPAIVNVGFGAFIGDVLLRHVRRENSSRVMRVLSWDGIGLLVSLAVSVNVGFAYLRVTGSVDGLLQRLLAGRLDYMVPAIASLGLMIFAWSTVKWWYSAHPNLQIERLGRDLDILDFEIATLEDELERDAAAAVVSAGDDIDVLEENEGQDVQSANTEFGELILLMTRLVQVMDAIQTEHQGAINDYNRMIFDGLGPEVPEHYKQQADLSETRPGMPDMSSLGMLIDGLERDFRRLRQNAAAARCELALEPGRTLQWAEDEEPIGGHAIAQQPRAANGSSNDVDSARPAGAGQKDLPDIIRRDAAE